MKQSHRDIIWYNFILLSFEEKKKEWKKKKVVRTYSLQLKCLGEYCCALLSSTEEDSREEEVKC